MKFIVTKVPDEVFPLSLSDDMFSLAMNERVAANFLFHMRRGDLIAGSLELMVLF
ncbi:hypothetical protein MED121_23990 [Marinomonas sp. MED121]|nr:hypothetical protein MED121_23990 [Marinomonas sp. MED121]